MNTGERLAGIDVHKSMLAVAVGEIISEGHWQFQGRKFAACASQLKELEHWLSENEVQEVVMESTAQYWKPVWQQLEGKFHLHLAQAQSNRAPKGRKQDFADAERLVRRFSADELILSCIPDSEQRLWRTLTHTKYQLKRDRVRLQNQLESLLEDAHIKLSSYVTDLLGVSSRRMLEVMAGGETDPARLAAMAHAGLRASNEQLQDALQAAATLNPLHRQILRLFLTCLHLIESHIESLDHSISEALCNHHDAVLRLAEVPGYGVDSAQQVIAEVGPAAATFPSPKHLSSWVGACPGREESAEASSSNRSPKGNRAMRRVLNQVANAAVKAKGTVWQARYLKLRVRLGHNKAIWAIVHRLCRLTWKILHQGVGYIEYGNRPNPDAAKKRIGRLVRELRWLGYNVQLAPVPPT